MSAYDYEGTAATQLPPNQRQMMSGPPQPHLPPAPGGNNPQHHPQQQLPQMGGPNPYGGYPGQQQHHRPSINMQGGQQGGNPGFMHQAAPNHRSSMPPPMNLPHQYSNQGGYNPNFNPNQHMPPPPPQHHPQYNHPSQYSTQQHMQPHPMAQPQHAMQRQNTGNYSHPGQQQQQQQHQQHQQQPPPQLYNQQSSYGRQPSNSGSIPDGQNTSVGGGPLNFNSAPALGNSLLANAGGPNGPTGGGMGLGGDYGQQFLPSGLNGDWQSDNDMHHRREMIQHIVKLLKQKDKNASPEWLTKLPQMVKQLEVSLYRSAPSFDAYSDISTLKMRLQQLAMEIAQKTQQAKDGSGFDGSGGGQSSSRGQSGHRSLSGNVGAEQQGMNDKDDLMGSFNMPSVLSGSGRGDNDASFGGDALNNQHGDPNDPDWKVRVRHKQQRLLLLHHSSKCLYEDGKCKITPYCGEMKKLWKHMARCTDNDCRVAHCFSSRSILSHYRKCKDPRCPACGPVRETVRKTQKSPRAQSQHLGGGVQMPGVMDIDGNSYGMSQDGRASMQMSNSMMQPANNNNSTGSAIIPTSQMGSIMGMMQGNDNNMGVSDNMGLQNAAPMDRMMTGGVNNSGAIPVNSMNPSGQQNQSNMLMGRQQNQPKSHGESNWSAGIIGSQQMFPPPNDHHTTDANGHNNMEPDAKARHKRQRLLLLRHASKCTAENGTCTITPHCAEMKELWKHIASCKDSYCKVRHCMSSRYVLSHYRRCKPPCNICDPVREIIKNGFNNHIEVDPAIMEGSGTVRTTPPIANTEYQPQTKKQKIDHDSFSTSTGGMPAPSSLSATSQHSGLPQSLNTDKINSTQGQNTDMPPSSDNGATQLRQQSPKPNAPNPTEDHALLECFTTEQVKTHIQSLQKFAKLALPELKIKCLEVLKGLQSHEHGWVFATPVNPVELGLDDYFDIIKKPMDLGTIQKKLESGSYHSFEDFRSDVRLTFENAMKYNEERTVVHEMAKELKKKFETDFKKLMKQLDKEHAENSKKVQACGLCGCEKLNFEPPVFFCNGVNCPTTRIRRNTNFYISADKQYAWCNQCYTELKGDIIDCGSTKIKKSELSKRKNDEVHEESWVQCDDCERWIHQICGLYNTRQDKENTSAYSCPLCLLDKRKKDGDALNLPEAPSANDIPRTKLSDWLEKHVSKKMDARIKELAEEKAETENISYDKAYKALSVGGPLTIRQVTSTDRKHEVRELMKARYAHKGYPDEFAYRCKCIVMFQNIDGVDVILFALYLYEHGDDNPLPNKRTVYVSYLDSVHFMQPRKMRTFIYHEILISYLDYARNKGFQQAFIWACPPLKGDDYIFYAKPEDQKTPKDVRLRQWYVEMLEECQKRDIVGKVTNMYDQYFNDKTLDASVVPYFEGDYFPGEAENIIKELNDQSTKGTQGGKKKSSSKSKKAVVVTNGSSSGSGSGDKPLKEGDRDPVMHKFCDAISGMKESFMVAFLNCIDAKPEHLVVPQHIIEYRDSKKLLENVTTEEEMSAEAPLSTSNEKQVDRFGRPIRVLDDDTDEIDCEFFNTRQAFLDLCRGNHYQFDELRRAKHTSMMVLWHLQNREAPKFVQQCAACAREISSGIRHHCNICPDFDLCQDCALDPKTNRGQCTHQLEKIKVDTGSSGVSGLTEEQRKERQKNIQLHIALIEHASQCKSTTCSSANCQKMKSYLKHGQVCKVKASGGCKVCKRIWTLLRIHAQQCKNSNCPIPQCIAIRKRIRQLQLKQRAMDDRRRQEMNRHYRMGMMSS